MIGSPHQYPPVFIGGMQRSGTSLMRAIIGSHPDIAIIEYDIPVWELHPRFKNHDFSIIQNRHDLLQAILSHPKIELLPFKFDKNLLFEQIQENDFCNFGAIVELMFTHYAGILGKSRWGLKTPGNEFFTDAIFQFFPTACMIQMVRDPRDVAVSIQKRGWHYDIVDHRRKWEQSLTMGLHYQQVFERYRIVIYEELVANPELIIKDICKLIEVSYEPAMLQFSEFQAQMEGSSSFGNITAVEDRVISTTARERYRKHLSNEEIWFYQQTLRKYQHILPYTLHNISQIHKIKSQQFIIQHFLRKAQGIFNLVKTNLLRLPNSSK